MKTTDALAFLILTLSAGTVHAQVVRDGSIGPDATFQPAGPDYLIPDDMGRLAGNNLFHSFAQFSVASGESATFTGPDVIENVIARITGDSASFIDGALRSEIADAALWLVNPRGVMFGPGASLDLDGSLRISTAAGLDFADGQVLAADLAAGAVLTAAAPVDFGLLGGSVGHIEVSGAKLVNGNGFSLRSGVIEIVDGSTLSAHADAGVAPGGIELYAGERIAVGAPPPGVVPRIGATFDVATLDSRTDAADPAGAVILAAPLIEVREAGGIGSFSFGSGAGADLVLRADERLEFSGMRLGRAGEIGSALVTLSAGVGAGGGILIEAGELLAGDGAQLRSISQASGTSGAISISATRVALDGGSEIESQSIRSGDGGDVTIVATDEILIGGALSEEQSFESKAGFGSGVFTKTREASAGALRLEAPVIVLTDGARVDSATFGTGTGGDVDVVASESLTVSGRASLFGSLIGVLSLGPGDAGTLRIETPSLLLENGGEIEADTLDSGRGGNIEIMSGSVTIRGDGGEQDPDRVAEFAAGLAADAALRGTVASVTAGQLAALSQSVIQSNISADAAGSGAAGTIQLTADSITLEDGGRITSLALGSGDGGEIRLMAGSIEIDGRLAGPGEASEISAAAKNFEGFAGDVELTLPAVTGRAGRIFLVVNDLQIRDGATVSSESQGTGDAGDIRIAARNSVRILNASVTTEAKRALGGNIRLSAGDILILRDSALRTNVGSGEGSGGDVTIDADADEGIALPRFAVLDNSSITAKADAGSGGNIRLASEAFISSAGSMLDASSRTGVDGEVEVVGPEVNADPGRQALTGSYVDPTRIVAGCPTRTGPVGSFVLRSRRGLPESPEELLLAFDVGLDASVTGRPASGTATLAAANDFGAGAQLLLRGSYSEAEPRFLEAAAGFAQAGATGAQADALSAAAQANIAMGDYAGAGTILAEAVELAGTDRARAEVGSLQAAVYLAQGRLDQADEVITRAIRLDRKQEYLNTKGRIEEARVAPERALEFYKESAKLARAIDDHATAAKALANAARAALQAGRIREAGRLMPAALEEATALASGRDQAFTLIHIGKSYLALARSSPSLRATALLGSYAALGQAEAVAAGLGDRGLTRSYALGNQAALYLIEQRLDEALYLTRRAAEEAAIAGAPESEYRWHWQEGQILWRQGARGDAIAAFRRAVEFLEETQRESLVRYGTNSASLRRSLSPVYLDLVDALLQEASRSSGADRVAFLTAARATMEDLKGAELRDYFEDACLPEREGDMQTVVASGNVAVVYPIVLGERLELLVEQASGLESYVVDVSEKELNARTLEFRRALQDRGSTAYRDGAGQLYEWLIAPYAHALSPGIDTLVFVPGGALRTIPLAALHDGAGFLIERYAVAVTPSLALTDPRALTSSRPGLLLAGLSQFEAPLYDLPNVPTELEAIQRAFGGSGRKMLPFTTAELKAALLAEQPAIVHLATHGEFTGDPATSYLQAADGRLYMHDLEAELMALRYRQHPVELLVLSACQTALDDDRAALGLAGIGIRAGARSAMGSLWNIPDASTATLFERFYQGLRQRGLSKSAALAQAQRELIQDERYGHPFFWSGILLISSWL